MTPLRTCKVPKGPQACPELASEPTTTKRRAPAKEVGRPRARLSAPIEFQGRVVPPGRWRALANRVAALPAADLEDERAVPEAGRAGLPADREAQEALAGALRALGNHVRSQIAFRFTLLSSAIGWERMAEKQEIQHEM